MFCKFCGYGIDDDSIYCRHCGRKVSFGDMTKSNNDDETPLVYRHPDEIVYGTEDDIEEVEVTEEERRILFPEKEEPTESETPAAQPSLLYYVFAILAFFVLIVGSLIGGFAIAKATSTDKKPSLDWKVGSLDAEGAYIESDTSIYTENLFECRGLTILPKQDAPLLYRVFFYDDQKLFIGKTVYYKGRSDGTLSVPFFAKYARIEIKSVDDESGEEAKIRKSSISKYAKQLTVSVDRAQSTLQQRFEAYTSRYNYFSRAGEGWYYDANTFSAYETGFFWSKKISTSYATNVIVKLKTSTVKSTLKTQSGFTIPAFACYGVSGKEMKNIGDNDTAFVIFEQGDYTYLSVNVREYDYIIIYTDEASAKDVEAYKFLWVGA